MGVKVLAWYIDHTCIQREEENPLTHTLSVFLFNYKGSLSLSWYQLFLIHIQQIQLPLRKTSYLSLNVKAPWVWRQGESMLLMTPF